MLDFYLVLRATEDWNSLSLDTYFDDDHACVYEDEHVHQRNMMTYNLKKWDAFECDFFRYRSRLKELAMSYWTLPYISLQEAIQIKDPNVVLIPIDDDDIVHPKIVDWIRHWYNIPEVDSVTWNGWTYSILRQRPMWTQEHECLHENPYHNTLLLSNGYSIRSNMADEDMMMRHDVFSDVRYLNRIHLNRKLALRTVHPGGTWLMQHMHVFGAEQFNWAKMVTPSDVGWGEDFVKDVEFLTKTIFQRPKRG